VTDINTLQERLNAQADRKLVAHIDKAFAEVDKLGLHNVKTQLTHKQCPHTSQFREVWLNLKTVAVLVLQESWREAESAAFLEKVERLWEEIDELRDQVCEGAS
jgi:hypothetical protein